MRISGITPMAAMLFRNPVRYHRVASKRYVNYDFVQERKEYAKKVAEARRWHKEEYWNL